MSDEPRNYGGYLPPDEFNTLLKRPFKRLHYMYCHPSKPEKDPKLVKVVGSARTLLKNRWKKDFASSRFSGETYVEFSMDVMKMKIMIHGLAFDSSLPNAESMRRAINLVKMLEHDAKEGGFTHIVTDRTIINPKLAKKMGYSLVKQLHAVKGKPTYKYCKALPQPRD